METCLLKAVADGGWVLAPSVVRVVYCIPVLGYEDTPPYKTAAGLWVIPPGRVGMEVSGVGGVMEMVVPAVH